MKTKELNLVVIAAIGIILTSCYRHNWETLHPGNSVATKPCTIDTSTVMSYSSNIVPIINTKCATNGSCHGAGTPNPDFTSYPGVYSVCMGDTANSSAWQDITGQSGNPMPQVGSAQLTSCEKAAIRNWIHQGALNN